MAQLSEIDQSRAFFHTGMSGQYGIPAQDIMALNRSITQIRDITIKKRIIEQLDACDVAYARTDMTNEPAVYKSVTVGDLNRSESRFDLREAHRRWWDFYLAQTDKLCQMLWVPNYWREEVSRYRFERWGAEFIQIEKNWVIADTAVASQLELTKLLSGGSGF